MPRPGVARLGSPWQVLSRHDLAWHGSAGLGTARLPRAWQGFPREARQVMTRQDVARQVKAGRIIRSTDQLAAELAVVLARHPDGRGFKELALEVSARAATVRGVLLDRRDVFSGPIFVPGARKHIYRLRIFDGSPHTASGRPTPAGSGSPMEAA